MKKIIFALLLTVATLAATANEVRYFTNAQAFRTVDFLNRQNELMIYCGYPNELPTYVILSDVWSEPVNPQYNEIWIFGYDAYTGEEIYMPIDLGCIWLVNNGNIYSAAQVLRFRSSYLRPTFAWAMPHYNPFHRIPHPHGYHRTYHYDVHLYGWDPFAPNVVIVYHPYYHRHIHQPAPMPPIYTPGIEQPIVQRGSNYGEVGYGYAGSQPRSGSTPTSPVTTTTTRMGSNPAGTSSRGGNNTTSSSRGGNASTSSSSRGTSGTATSGNSNRGDNSSTTNSSRGTSTTATSGNNTRGTSASSSTSSRGTSATATSGSSTRGSSTSASSSSSSSSRGASASSSTSSSSRSNNSGTSTSSSSSSRGSSTGTSSSSSSRSGSKSAASTSSSRSSSTSSSTSSRGTSNSSSNSSRSTR